MTNREKLEDLLLDILLLDPSEFRFDLKREEIQTWDSMGVVAIAVGVDETFGYHFTPDEWVLSGDLGEPMDDGGWRLLGRANEVFKRYGEKISLPRLLTTVKSHWSGDAVFYQEVDPNGEQACVLVLSPEPDKQEVRQILMAFRNNHSRPHWPLRIESLEQMPLLPSGKIDTLALAEARGKQLHWRQRI
jgi:acyl-CoA synthetase (AMP-forming)/AMP-acid ligase II